jgi:hypothetical protein
MRTMKIFRHFALLLVLALSAPGCASKGEQKPKKPAATTAPAAPPQAPKVPFWRKLLYYSNPLNLLPKKAKPPKAQPPQIIGTVKMVNMDDKYVLVDAMSQNLEPGDLLVCINAQQETANLRMSPLKNPPFLIADIASGTPAVGDRVFKP